MPITLEYSKLKKLGGTGEDTYPSFIAVFQLTLQEILGYLYLENQMLWN